MGRRALCIKTAVTSQGALAWGSTRLGLGPGAGPEEEEEEEEEAQPRNPILGGRGPGNPAPR